MLPVAVVDIDLGAHARPGSAAAFMVLAALIVSFLAIRTSARLTRSVSWWPGGVESSSGVHLHHLVWGICLMMISGFLAFAVPLEAPWWHIVAILFGIGAGFTLDEFALWVYLDDVYWSPEGRSSFDAVVFAVVFAALVLLGTTPLGLDDPGSIVVAIGTASLVLAFSITCFLKGRIMYGLVGLFIPIFSIVGAARLAMPKSPWAKRLYSPSKLERSRRRFPPDRRTVRLQRRIGDLVAGAPTPTSGADDDHGGDRAS